MPRYQTSGIPPSQAAVGLSAFLPHFNRLAASGAQSYKGHLTGRPGTQAIPIEGLGFPVPSPDLGDLAQMGGARSSDAPPFIWPQQWYDLPDPVFDTTGGTARVQVYNPVAPELTTMIPVPAIDLRGVYQARAAMLSGGIDNQRQGALKQATSFIRWPRRRTGNGPGTGG